MDEDSSRLTAELLVWVNLLGTLMGWYPPSLGLWVNHLQESSGNGIFDKYIGFLLGSETGLTLVNLLYYETWPQSSHQLIVENPPGSKVRYPDLVGSPLRTILAVHPSESGLIFPSLPSGACPNYPFQAKLDMTFSGLSPIIHRWCGCSWQYRKAKGDNKV